MFSGYYVLLYAEPLAKIDSYFHTHIIKINDFLIKQYFKLTFHRLYKTRYKKRQKRPKHALLLTFF